jgi:hypothetical protein
MGNNRKNAVVQYANSSDLLQDVCLIIDNAREAAYCSINVTMVQRTGCLASV